MKQRAATLSVLSNTSLVTLKVVAGLLTGSVSILSEALHSGTDQIASLMAYISIRKAEAPADAEHPFGHGKFENLSGLAEALLIVLAGGYIMYEAVLKIIEPEEIRLPSFAIAVMALSAMVNWVVSRYLYRVARQTDSIALEADAKHLSIDVYTSVGVFIGLILVYITGKVLLDPLIALVIAAVIFYEGMQITAKSVQGLLDRSLPAEEIEIIKDVLVSHSDFIKDYHNLRTRKSGSERHIDLHLTVCQRESIADTHNTMDSIEREISSRLSNCKVVIHPEPCIYHADKCPSDCYWLRIEKKRD